MNQQRWASVCNVVGNVSATKGRQYFCNTDCNIVGNAVGNVSATNDQPLVGSGNHGMLGHAVENVVNTVDGNTVNSASPTGDVFDLRVSTVAHQRSTYGGRPSRRGLNQKNGNGCYGCGQPGHYKRECPMTKQPESVPGNNHSRISNDTAAEIYVDAKVDGRQVICLLDTGCERSIIGRKLVPNLQLTNTEINLFAANGTPIPLCGAVPLKFTLSNVEVMANVVVSESIEELNLGIDWLSSNNCQWDFGTAKLSFGNCVIPVYKRPTRSLVRRI